MYLLYIWVCIVPVVSCYYLTKNQQISICKMLGSKDIDNNKKNEIKEILVAKYSWWAIGKAQKFQEKYNIHSNYIQRSEYINSALLGLCNSMKSYDGRVPVPYYADWYIQHELYKSFTRSHPFGQYNHYQMMNCKYKVTKSDQITPLSTFEYSNNLVTERSNKNNYNFDKDAIISMLNTVSTSDRRIFCLRYDIDNMNVKHTYKKIAELMVCSRTSIGNSLSRSLSKIKKFHN